MNLVILIINYIISIMNKKVNCPCGSIICFSSLNAHLKTKKHENLYVLKQFPKLKMFENQIEDLYNKSQEIPESEYIQKSNIIMNDYNFWKNEYSVRDRKWHKHYKNDEKITIAYITHQGKYKYIDLYYLYV
jgi:hypothetical protein